MSRHHGVRTTIIALLTAAAALGGCASQRPADAMRDSGDWHFKRGEYAMAAAEYESIAKRYPGDWQAQYQLGLCLIETEQYASARRALEVANDRKPHDPAIADALAEAMFHQGDEEHLYTFLRERAEEEQTPRAYLRLARYAARVNDPDTARVAIDTAIRLDNGQSVTPYIAAADLAERLGDLDRAVRRLHQAYGIDPYNEKVSERLRALGEIPGPTLAMPADTRD
jgi:tetratricopeptide (TPR) repeat protein